MGDHVKSLAEVNLENFKIPILWQLFVMYSRCVCTDNCPLKSSSSCYSLYTNSIFYMYISEEKLMKTDNCFSVYLSSNCF